MKITETAVIVVGLPFRDISDFLNSGSTKEMFKEISDLGFEIIHPYHGSSLSDCLVGWIVASSPYLWYSEITNELVSDINVKVELFRKLFDGIEPRTMMAINYMAE